MRKTFAFICAIIFIMANFSKAYAIDVDENNNDNSGLEISDTTPPEAVGDRGTLRDLCAAGFKQYCPENRGKYKRKMTNREIKCIASLGVATRNTLKNLTALNALMNYGFAIISCLP